MKKRQGWNNLNVIEENIPELEKKKKDVNLAFEGVENAKLESSHLNENSASKVKRKPEN